MWKTPGHQVWVEVRRETRDLKAQSAGDAHKELGCSWSPGLGENRECFQETQVYSAQGFGLRKRRGRQAGTLAFRKTGNTSNY